MRGFYLLLFLALVVNVAALGQTAGDFRSATSGPWDQASTWETFDGVTWNPAVAAPTSADGVITIVFATQVDISTTITADDIYIEGDAILNVQSGGRLIVVNGAAANDLDIAQDDGFGSPDGHLNALTGGIVENRGFINSTPTNFQVDGTVIHNQLTGFVPIASWNTGSTLEVQGVTSGTAFVAGQGIGPGGFQGQAFYNVRWNCTTQSASIHLQGHLTSIAGNLDVVSTGNAGNFSLLLTGPSTLPSPSYDPLNIGGNFTVSGNGTVGAGINTGGIGYVINVTGNLVLSSSKTTVLSLAGNSSLVGLNVTGNLTKTGAGQVILATTAGAASPTATFATLDVNGNITWNAGNMILATGTNTGTPTHACVGRINAGGDLSIVAGNWREDSNSSNGRGEIYFDDNHTHSFTTSVAITPTTPFNFTVNFYVPPSNRLNIASGAALTGNGIFSLSAGGTLGVYSPDGLVNSTGFGNVRVSGFRQYAASSNIVYNGSVAQNLGEEWSFTGALNNVGVNLEIDNSSGVLVNFTQPTIPPNTTLVGRLTLTNGGFDPGPGNTLTVQGDYSRTNGTITGHDDSSLVFSGAGGFSTNLAFTPGNQSLQNFTHNRSVDILLGSALTIHSSGALIFQGSGNLRLNGNALTINGDITRPSGSGAIASSNVASSLTIAGSGALTILPICGAACGGNQFGNVTFNRGGGASYTWSGNSTINGTIALLAGTLTHNSGITMATGSTFQRGGGTTFTVVGALGATSTYNVVYSGALNPTGDELPTAASNRLNDLTVGDDVTLDKSIRINGTLNLNSGTLNAGNRDVTMAGASIVANGGSFTMDPTSSFIFARAGTTTMSGSTIGNINFGNFTINTGATASAPNANINVTGTWTNNGTFTPNSGEVTFAAAGAQNIDANGQSFFDLTTANGTKTLINNVDVNGTLTIETGSTLDGSSFNINLAGNWDNQGTFTASTSTLILDGTTQSLNGASQPFFNLTFANSGTKTLASIIDVNGQLTINPSVTLDVSASNFRIDLAGNFVNNGAFNAGNGTLVLDGAVIQNLGGTTNTQFRNITITNPSTVTVATAQSITDVLTLNGGVFNPNGNFTMVSTAARDARIAPLGPLASISATNMTIQRYLPNTNASQSYRYLSSPMLNAVVNGWKDDFPITGTHTDPSTVAEWPAFPTMNVSGPSLYRYNEPQTPTTTIDDRYQSWPRPGFSTSATALDNGRGYAAFVRQTGPITIELVGQAATGARAVTLTNQAGGANDGWNLVGNPYPAPINWDNVTIPAGVNAQIALKDNTNNIGLGAGQYVYFTQGAPGVGIPVTYTGTIAQGQAFWVRKTTAGPATLTFQEDDKQATSTPPFMRDGDKDMLRINVTGNTRMDELLIRFQEGAQDKAENMYDAEKLKNDFINFSSLSSDGREMAINTFGSLACSREIPLVLKTVTPGAHKFTFSQMETFSSEVDIRLLDTFTGQTFNVTSGSAVYDFSVTSNPASFGSSRFRMFVGYKPVELGLNVQSQDVCNGNTATVTIQSPQSGVAYYATLNGTTISESVTAASSSEVTITIPTSTLNATQDNNVVLMAKIGSCTALPLTNHAVINVKSIPVIAGVTNAAHCGEASLTLQASGAPTDGSYKWYLTEDATDPIAGATASSFTTPVLSKTRTYFVSAVNSLGCEGARMPVTASIAYPYDVTEVVNAESCAGNSLTLSASGAPEGGSYRWYASQSATEPIANQSSGTYVTPALSATTTYFVATVNASGCEGSRVPVTATITSIVNAVISVDGEVLVSNFETGNQWYLNGTLIPGATGKTYQPTQSGIYRLVVTSGKCSTQVEKEFSITGDISGESNKGYVLYPNPSSGTVYVEVATTDAVRVSVRNQLGSEVTGGELKQDGQMRRGQFDISGQANGVYLVVIRHGEQTVIRKIVKN